VDPMPWRSLRRTTPGQTPAPRVSGSRLGALFPPLPPASPGKSLPPVIAAHGCRPAKPRGPDQRRRAGRAGRPVGERKCAHKAVRFRTLEGAHKGAPKLPISLRTRKEIQVSAKSFCARVCAPLCARQRGRCAHHTVCQTGPASGSWTMITGADRLPGPAAHGTILRHWRIRRDKTRKPPSGYADGGSLWAIAARTGLRPHGYARRPVRWRA
jgi:hypothetical protein